MGGLGTPPSRVASLILTISSLGAGCQCFGPVDDDAGVTVQACPLTEGVCTGAVSRRIGGQWTPCDYGPDFQTTETRCDGLDNDCDGRVDISWKRVLIPGDGGSALAEKDGVFGSLPNWELLGGEIDNPYFVRVDGGTKIVLANTILDVSDDLRVTHRTDFLGKLASRTYLFPDGPGWIRIARDSPNFAAISGREFCVYGHSVGNDGSYLRNADGTPATLWNSCRLNPRGFGVLEIPGGWFVGTANYCTSSCPSGSAVGWLTLNRDAGLTSGTVDGGPTASMNLVAITGEGRVLFSENVGSGNPPDFRVWGLSPNGPSLSLEALIPGYCFLASDAPMTFSCPGNTSWRLLDVDGGLLATDVPRVRTLWKVGSRLGPLASRMDHDPGLTDGGTVWPSLAVMVARSGQLTEFAHVSDDPITYTLSAGEITGRLVLLTWGENGQRGGYSCPLCKVGNFVAEFACVPP